jgi:hypothetical protein
MTEHQQDTAKESIPARTTEAATEIIGKEIAYWDRYSIF